MKTFKMIDVWGSAALIVYFLLAALIRQDETLIYGYFAVGAWQVISMLVHLYAGRFCQKGGARNTYHRAVVIVLCCVLAGLVFYPLLMIVLVILLFAAPVMAIYYTWLCYEEVYVKMKRPLAILK